MVFKFKNLIYLTMNFKLNHYCKYLLEDQLYQLLINYNKKNRKNKKNKN